MLGDSFWPSNICHTSDERHVANRGIQKATYSEYSSLACPPPPPPGVQPVTTWSTPVTVIHHGDWLSRKESVPQSGCDHPKP